jgi:hypothetical protein
MIERVIARTFFCEKEHHPLRIKNDLRAPVEESRIAAPHSSPPRAARGRGQPRDKPPSPIRNFFSLLLGMCKSQHAADVRAQHERSERRKITKSVKEIHTHLNLQPLVPPLFSRVKKAQKLRPSRKGLLALMKKLRCNSGMVMQALAALALTMVAWLEHPHLTLLRQIRKILKKATTKTTMMSEASRRPPNTFWVLNDKGGEISIKAWKLSSFVFSSVLSGKTGLSSFPNWTIRFCPAELIIYLLFLVSVDLKHICNV